MPQNYCTGPAQLKIASQMAPIVKLLMKLMFFVAKPLASFMNTLLRGERNDRFIKPDLRAMHEMSVRSSHNYDEEAKFHSRSSVNHFE